MNGKEIRELEAQLKTLETKKKTEVTKKKMMEDDVEDDIENEIQKKVILNGEIHDLKRDKRLYDEKRTKFIADHGVFLRIEKEMKCGKRVVDSVPEIFQRSYDMFKQMRENGVLGKPQEEMFEYFMANLERVDFYSGKHNTLFDAPTFDELKAFCPSDDEYESASESSDEDETENMINDVLNNKTLDELMHDDVTEHSINYDSDDTETMVQNVLNGTTSHNDSEDSSIDTSDGEFGDDSSISSDSSEASEMSMSKEDKEKIKLMHSLMSSMNKPFGDTF
jgi:hypothetical protein